MSELTNGGRAQAYQALRESEELHRATLSNISDAVFLTDDEGVFTFVCPRGGWAGRGREQRGSGGESPGPIGGGLSERWTGGKRRRKSGGRGHVASAGESEASPG